MKEIASRWHASKQVGSKKKTIRRRPKPQCFSDQESDEDELFVMTAPYDKFYGCGDEC
jgi:hypothetical protein